MSDKMYDVGKIVNTHGIRGEVKVLRITDFEERFAVGEKLYLVRDNQATLELEVTGHRVHKQFDLLCFKGFDNINDVEIFKNSHLKIKEDQLTELETGEYYFHEIIDCEVYTVTGDKLGVIKEVLTPGANDVWVIEQLKGKDILIPFIKDVVKEINIKEKKVIIDPLEGLLD